MTAFRKRYGDGPLHLISVAAALAIAGYALTRIAASPEPIGFAVWFGGAIVAHDLIAFPVYTGLNLLAGRASPVSLGPGAINYVRVPAILSAFAFVAWFPLILGLADKHYVLDEGHDPPSYLGRWLLLTAVLFAGAGVAYAIRRRRARPRGPATDRPGPRTRG